METLTLTPKHQTLTLTAKHPESLVWYGKTVLTCWTKTEQGWWGQTSAMENVGSGPCFFPAFAWKEEK